MTDPFTPKSGGPGRVSFRGETYTRKGGEAWFRVTDPTAAGMEFSLASGAEVRLDADAKQEWAVAHGLSEDEGAGPEDAAGYEAFDDEAAAFQDAQWRVEPGVFVRDVVVGPWRRAVETDA